VFSVHFHFLKAAVNWLLLICGILHRAAIGCSEFSEGNPNLQPLQGPKAEKNTGK
jgi:hypothetical protein